MLQPSPATTIPLAERLRTAAGRRALGMGLALLIEALLLLLLLSLGSADPPVGRDDGLTVVNVTSDAASEDTPEPQREQQVEQQQPATEQPLPPRPAEPLPARPAKPNAVPTPRIVIPTPAARPPAAANPPPNVRPAPSGKSLYGPPDKGGSAMRDTERVGTAPNGEPLYAAAWYREPGDDELRGYMATARGPGWGLIACRTAPNYRVEDCVALDEYPDGSQINRAVLAAAWQFQVRPPRRGGVPQVGSWVRIRIDYGIGRR